MSNWTLEAFANTDHGKFAPVRQRGLTNLSVYLGVKLSESGPLKSMRYLFA